MLDNLHNAIIDKACRDGGWQRGNWKRAFLTAARENDSWSEEVEDGAHDELFAGFRQNPDAWRLVVEDENTPDRDWSYPVLVLEFLEVEISHPMPLNKRRAYVSLWWRFDGSTSFHFRVYRAERYKAPELWLDAGTVYDEMTI